MQYGFHGHCLNKTFLENWKSTVIYDLINEEYEGCFERNGNLRYYITAKLHQICIVWRSVFSKITGRFLVKQIHLWPVWYFTTFHHVEKSILWRDCNLNNVFLPFPFNYCPDLHNSHHKDAVDIENSVLECARWWLWIQIYLYCSQNWYKPNILRLNTYTF